MIAVLLLAAVAAAQAPAVIHQSTSGWCSPVIANVVGNVTVNCIGVDPRALSRLNAQLAGKNQQLAAKIAEANDWVDRYHELEAQLRLAGANRELSKQAEDYVHQGEFEKARTVLDQLLKEDAKEQDRIAGDYYQRGLLAELEFKPQEALPDFERAYLLSPDKLTFANKYTANLLDEHEFAKAEPVLNAAIEKGRGNIAKNQTADREPFSWLLYSRAVLMAQTSRFNAAEQDYQEAIAQFRVLAKDNPRYQQHVANVLTDLGNVLQNTGRMDAANSAFNEAAGIVRGLPDSESKNIFLSEILLNQALVYMALGKTSDAVSLTEQSVGILRELAKAKPAAYEANLGLALNNMAAYQQVTGHLPEAEQTGKESVEILSRAAASNPGAHNAEAAQAYATYANILSGQHRRDEADANFQKSLAILRDLAKQSPEGYEKDLAKILYETGYNEWNWNRNADAEKSFNESLQIRRRLAATSFEAYGPGLAEVADGLGRLYVADNNMTAAEPLLREAVDAYRRLAAASPGRYQAPMARDLQVLALVYVTRKDLAQTRQVSKDGLEIFLRLRAANAEFDHQSMAICMLLYAAVTEQENPSQACTLVSQAAEITTDAATRQAAQAQFQKCSRGPGLRR
jgi:hypothetical protein